VSAHDFKTAYRRIMDDNFPAGMEISFVGEEGRQTLVYEKATWVIDAEEKGLRYGENPGQEAALYRLVNGNLVLGGVTLLAHGRHLASDIELLQSGKHPGKINITDADNALNILRYFAAAPCAVIVKHNNPCGAAKGSTLAEAYHKAHMADRLAAFGGAIALNREVDKETAELIAQTYAEVVLAPEFAHGVMEIFARWKNLRVMRIERIARLGEFVGARRGFQVPDRWRHRGADGIHPEDADRV
jgi:phosphoribosylaminoimidazolecarboxamide formyltransferase/IMP cyclohydrolase